MASTGQLVAGELRSLRQDNAELREQIARPTKEIGELKEAVQEALPPPEAEKRDWWAWLPWRQRTHG